MMPLALLTVMVLGAGAGETVLWVELLPQVEVLGTRVVLSDIARVDGLDARATERAKRIEVARFRSTGDRLIFERGTVRRVLEQAGFGGKGLEIRGAARCSVRPRSVQLDSQRVIGMARRHIENALVGQQGVLGIEYAGEALDLRIPAARFRSKLDIAGDPKNPRYAGLVNLRLLVRIDGETMTSRAVPMYVRRRLSIVVAKRRVSKGRPIGFDDVVLEEREVTRLGPDVLTSVEELVGMLAAQPIARGQAVLRRSVKALPVIRRGAIVTAILSSGGIRLEALCRARQAGAPGERIVLENVESRRSVYGVVIDSRTVRVRLEN